jgi:hypothetical protein
MLKIQRSSNGHVVFTVSGQMDEDDIAEMEVLLRSEKSDRRIVLDLKDLTLAGRDAIGSSRAVKRRGSSWRSARFTSASGSRESGAEVNRCTFEGNESKRGSIGSVPGQRKDLNRRNT